MYAVDQNEQRETVGGWGGGSVLVKGEATEATAQREEGGFLSETLSK